MQFACERPAMLHHGSAEASLPVCRSDVEAEKRDDEVAFGHRRGQLPGVARRGALPVRLQQLFGGRAVPADAEQRHELPHDLLGCGVAEAEDLLHAGERLVQCLLCFLLPPTLRQHGGEVSPPLQRLGVLGPQRPLLALQRLPRQRLGLERRGLALREHQAEVLQGHQRERMPPPNQSLHVLEGAAKQCLCRVVVSEMEQDEAQVARGLQRVKVVRAENPSPCLQHDLIATASFSKPTSQLCNQCFVVSGFQCQEVLCPVKIGEAKACAPHVRLCLLQPPL
mmetsp:Transcript_105161/g.307360  ORF Transcript_105161/g.307360 Transcript_105161/m.307360 type:complete len:281 (+) Transcript_105161:246-1088(+)